MSNIEKIRQALAEAETKTGKKKDSKILACLDAAERSEAIEASELTPEQKTGLHLASFLKAVEDLHRPKFQNGGVVFKPQ